MGAIIAGITGPKMGMTGEAYGYLDTIDKTETVEKEVLKNESGDIVNYGFTGKEGEVTVAYTIKSASEPDDTWLGHTAVLADSDFGETFYITSVGHAKAKAPGWYTGTWTGSFVRTSGFTTTTA